jgi:PBP1b-binding outer membrane lipoprotein LpoB
MTSQETMMTKKYRSILFIPFLLIGGCSSGEDQTTQKQSSKEHVFSDHTRALEKARGVEQVIQSGADKQRQAIEKQSQ